MAGDFLPEGELELRVKPALRYGGDGLDQLFLGGPLQPGDRVGAGRVGVAPAQQGVIDRYLSKSPATPTSFPLHAYVLVSYPERPPSKLHARWKGPMLVVAVQGNTYDVQDLITQEIQQVHLDRLLPYRHDSRDSDLSVAAMDNEPFLVDAVLAHRGSWRTRTKMEFKIRWLGYPPSEDSWESYSHVKSLAALAKYMDDNDYSFK